MVSCRLVFTSLCIAFFSILASACFFIWSSKRKATSLLTSGDASPAEANFSSDDAIRETSDVAESSIAPSESTAASSSMVIPHDTPAVSSLVVPNSTCAFGDVRVPQSAAINKTKKSLLELHEERYAAIIESEQQSVTLANPVFRKSVSADVRERELAKLRMANRVWRWPNLCNASSGATTREIAENGTIAVLLRTNSAPEMHELRTILLPSLIKHLRFKTTVTLMHEGDKEPLEKVLEPFNASTWFDFKLVDITYLFNATSADHYSVWQANSKRMSVLRHSKMLQRKQMAWSTMRCQDQPMGYRKMCAFWVVHAHTLPELRAFRYIWRLDTDSQLIAEVRTSLFGVMHRCGAVFGYAHHMKDHIGCCMGLKENAFKFYTAHPEFQPEGVFKSMESYDGDGCPAWNTHFQLMDLDYFRGSRAYNAFVNALQQDIIGWRWGDHIVMSFFLRAHEPPERILCMQPWVPGYVHQELGMSPHCHPHTALHAIYSRELRASLRTESLRWMRAEWHFKDKPQRSLGRGGSTNSSIVVLVNTDSEAEMHNLSTVLLPSLSKYLLFHSLVTFLYTGAEEKLKALTLQHSKSSQLSYLYVDVGALNLLSSNDRLQPLNPVSGLPCRTPSELEKKIYKFWAVTLHSMPELTGFRILWRLTPSSQLTAAVKTDLYDVLNRQGASFGYLRHVRDESSRCSSCKGLGNNVIKLMEGFPKILPLDFKEQQRTREFTQKFDKWRCPAWSGDFQIINMRYLRKSLAFNKYIHHIGKLMFAFGWSDITVLSLFYRIDFGQLEAPGSEYIPPLHILCLQPWVTGYKYAGKHVTPNCAHDWPETFGRRS